MPRLDVALCGGRNLAAFLDLIAYSEIGPELLAASDDGYNVIVGSTVSHPLLFDGYADHPRTLIDLGHGLKSTAAGRYQLLARYYDPYKQLLHLDDFSPESQDKIALQQIKECNAFNNIWSGDIQAAIKKCAHIWASFPGAGYGQSERSFESLIAYYKDSGGMLS